MQPDLLSMRSNTSNRAAHRTRPIEARALTTHRRFLYSRPTFMAARYALRFSGVALDADDDPRAIFDQYRGTEARCSGATSAKASRKRSGSSPKCGTMFSWKHPERCVHPLIEMVERQMDDASGRRLRLEFRNA